MEGELVLRPGRLSNGVETYSGLLTVVEAARMRRRFGEADHGLRCSVLSVDPLADIRGAIAKSPTGGFARRQKCDARLVCKLNVLQVQDHAVLPGFRNESFLKFSELHFLNVATDAQYQTVAVDRFSNLPHKSSKPLSCRIVMVQREVHTVPLKIGDLAKGPFQNPR
jgi:hypothetical protein